MKTNIFKTLVLSTVLFSACSKTGSVEPDVTTKDVGNSNAGVMTAGEWSDLNNWTFWENVSSKSEYKKYLTQWNINTKNRISVKVLDANAQPVKDALVQLQKDGSVVFATKTDNRGTTELWVRLFENNLSADFSQYQLNINNGAKIITNINPYSQGVNNITLSSTTETSEKVEIAFVIDATGSMEEPLKYLKGELEDVITRVKNNNSRSEIETAALFYRDTKDEYKISDFNSNTSTTINFIKEQKTISGAEAVHSALEKAINSLTWSASAKTRIMFFIFDSHPHYDFSVSTSLQNSIIKANEKGIKIIPIAASTVNKEAEFLMRSFAINTNGTYVFITNAKGKGKDQMANTVGYYQPEYLNNLMVRLINLYSN